MWIPPETKDPILLHYPTRKSVGYFGALRIRDGKFVYKREQTRFNADTFFEKLRHSIDQDKIPKEVLDKFENLDEQEVQKILRKALTETWNLGLRDALHKSSKSKNEKK